MANSKDASRREALLEAIKVALATGGAIAAIIVGEDDEQATFDILGEEGYRNAHSTTGNLIRTTQLTRGSTVVQVLTA